MVIISSLESVIRVEKCIIQGQKTTSWPVNKSVSQDQR